MHVPAYKLAANQLASNEEQWTAYESSENFVALAGPGSGKTKVLTTKLARMVSEDVEEPRGVACVTYSNECARELKRRLASLGVRPSRRVFIGTVHSFCFQHIVRPFAQIGGLRINNPIRVATNAMQDVCFGKAVANTLGVDENPRHWGLTCSDYRRSYLDREAPEWLGTDKAAARIIEEYERQLRAIGLIDFDDMMLLGLRLVEQHEWVRRALHAKFPILVVDEYQDLGLPLHRLVMSLCFREDGPGTRLFAVGDPDQSIYGFNGAKPGLLRDLSAHTEVESVTLRLNYRSRQDIISASEVALGETRGYESSSDDVGIVEFHHCKDGLADQAEYISTDLIPAVLESGVASCIGEVAVLYRTKNEGDVIAEHASSAGLDFIRADGNAAYPKTPLTRWLEECAAWCASTGSSSSLSLRSLLSEYTTFNRTLTSERNRLDASHQLVACLRALCDGEMLLHEWLSELSSSCLRSHLLVDPTMQQDVATLDKLIEAAGTGRLKDWTVARFGGQGGTPDHLNLMTLHSSKGLEFDVVILFGMDQGIIPSYKETTAAEKREPRRLFYVGLTRARHEVHMTFSGWRDSPWGRKNDGVSEFVLELRSKLGRR